MQLLDGKSVAARIRQRLAGEIFQLERAPGLAVILLGTDSASETYVAAKRRAAEEIGMLCRVIRLPESASQAELLAEIEKLNTDPAIDGMLVQLPLPAGIDRQAVLAAISPAKDADGFNPTNQGLLAVGSPLAIAPATPLGIVRLLDEYGIEIRGRDCCIVGASMIVGRPLAELFVNRGGTVTICHEFTADLASHTRRAEILVSATGQVGLIRGDMLRPGAAVLDVGIVRLENGKLVGDIDFESASSVAGWLTPVPGGVGPMTVAALLENVVACAKNLQARQK